MTTTALSRTLWFLGPEASPRGGERGNQDYSGESWESALDECCVNIIAQENRVNGTLVQAEQPLATSTTSTLYATAAVPEGTWLHPSLAEALLC